MKRQTVLAALLVLGACDQIPFLQGGGGEGNLSAANASGGNASASATPGDAGITSSRSLAGLGNESGSQSGKDPVAIPAGSPQGQVDPRLVGRWTDTKDCQQTAELRSDGNFVAPNGAMGRWHVAGNQLVFIGDGGEFRLRLDAIEPDRIVTTNSQGQTAQSTRC